MATREKWPYIILHKKSDVRHFVKAALKFDLPIVWIIVQDLIWIIILSGADVAWHWARSFVWTLSLVAGKGPSAMYMKNFVS